MTTPLVSVLLPVYNGAATIGVCITSILRQTYQNLELVVVNDGSTDNTHEVIASFDDARVIEVALGRNSGIAAALNAGLARCRGELIARIDCDDLCVPERIEKQVAFLDRHLEVGICGAYQTIFGGYHDGLNAPPTTHEAILVNLLFGPTMLHPTVMMRASLVNTLGNAYNPDFYLCEDYELWVRAARHTRLANIPEPLCSYRWESPKNWEFNHDNLIRSLLNIWREQYNNIGIVASNRKLYLHMMLVGRTSPKLNEIVELILFTKNIVIANRKTHVYNHILLCKALRRNLLIALARACGLGGMRSNLRDILSR